MIALILACLSLACPARRAAATGMAEAARHAVPPLYLGLDSYLNQGKLSYLEIGDRVEGASVADPGGSDHVVHELQVFRQAGPGIVTSMRMHQTAGSPWQLTADGTTIGFSPADLGSTGGNDFPFPLALNPAQDQGSSVIDTPVPFDRMVTLRSTTEKDAGLDGSYIRLPYGTPLRRTFDSCLGGQRAAVYVRGTYAGTWQDFSVSHGTGWDGHERCWRDEDFPLPAALTEHRTSITVRIAHPGPGSYWTASAYQLYSFVPPG